MISLELWRYINYITYLPTYLLTYLLTYCSHAVINNCRSQLLPLPYKRHLFEVVFEPTIFIVLTDI